MSNATTTKVPMPAGGITIKTNGAFNAKLLNDFERFTNGSMLMGFAPADVVEDDKVIGQIGVSVTGSTVAVKVGSATYKVELLDIFKLVQAAHEKSLKSVTDQPLIPTTDMQAQAQAIATRYGGGAIAYHAALAAILETTESLKVG